MIGNIVSLIAAVLGFFLLPVGGYVLLRRDEFWGGVILTIQGLIGVILFWRAILSSDVWLLPAETVSSLMAGALIEEGILFIFGIETFHKVLDKIK